jgi:hypothetical protein
MLVAPTSPVSISKSGKRTSIHGVERGVGENVNIIFIQMHAEF